MTSITFFNLSCSIMPKCFKKNCDRSWNIRLNNEKGIFLENWLTLLFSTHYATMSQKNTGKSCDTRCWSFVPNWTQITQLPVQGTFFKKLTVIFVYFKYPIAILQRLKKIIKVDHKIQGCIIFEQIGQRHFFWKNWL